MIASDVPIGAGLSSSAALEVACGFALLDVAGASIDLDHLAHAAQRAEHDFAGTRCGIMDQTIACHGRADAALWLDTRSLERRWLPLPPRVRVVVCNTMVRHELASGEYNARRADCEAGVAVLAQQRPNVRALRDATLADLDAASDRLSTRVSRRCRHVITENARVELAAEALEDGDVHRLGTLMNESHDSLRARLRSQLYGTGYHGRDRPVAGRRAWRANDGWWIRRMCRRSRRTGGGGHRRARDRSQVQVGNRHHTRGVADRGWRGRGRLAGRCVGMTDRPHRRFNPLRGEWVIVSAGRNARPWQGRIETPEPAQPPEYDANCYLCPGNERAHGVRNPRYASTFAFDNDFPALAPEPGFGIRDPQPEPPSSRLPTARLPDPDSCSPVRNAASVVCSAFPRVTTSRCLGWRHPRFVR